MPIFSPELSGQDNPAEETEPNEVDLVNRFEASWTACAEEAMGIKVWDFQRRILESVQRNKRTAVVSCSDSSKTFLSALCALIFLASNENSIVVTTAPTMRQVSNQGWREIRNIHRTSKLSIGGKILTTRLEFSDSWYAIGLSTREPEAFKGFHSKSGHILVVVDEAPGIRKEIWEAVETLMTQEGAKQLAIGNASRASGEFFEAFRGKAGWATICISAFDTPNLKAGSVVAPYLITPAYVEEKRAEWGESSPLYRSRILGQFIPDDPKLLIPLDMIERWTDCDEADSYKPEGVKAFGLDVARYGDNKSVLCRIHGKSVSFPFITGRESTMETAGRCKRELDSDTPDAFALDDGGLGGGVTDRLRELKYRPIAVAFGEKADDSEQFFDRRSEMYWRTREGIVNGQWYFERSRPGIDALRAQLSAIKYDVLSDGRIKVWSKDRLKKEEGLVSPDHADGFILAAWAQRRAMGRAGLTKSGAYVNLKGREGAEKKIEERRRLVRDDSVRGWLNHRRA